MLSSISVAAAIGLGLSALGRAPALLAASVIVTITSLILGVVYALTWLQIVISIAQSLVAMQAAFLIGSWLINRPTK